MLDIYINSLYAANYFLRIMLNMCRKVELLVRLLISVRGHPYAYDIDAAGRILIVGLYVLFPAVIFTTSEVLFFLEFNYNNFAEFGAYMPDTRCFSGGSLKDRQIPPYVNGSFVDSVDELRLRVSSGSKKFLKPECSTFSLSAQQSPYD